MTCYSYPWRVLASRVILASTRVIGKRVTPGPLICMHVMCSYYSEWNSFPECWIRYVLAACCWIRYDATTGTAVLHYICEYVLLLLGVCPSTISCVQDIIVLLWYTRYVIHPAPAPMSTIVLATQTGEFEFVTSYEVLHIHQIIYHIISYHTRMIYISIMEYSYRISYHGCFSDVDMLNWCITS